MNPTPSPTRHRRFVAVGALAAGLGVVGAGGAMAVAPHAGVSRTLSDALQSVGIEWSGMPEGYTAEQYTAFWDAGYTWGDAQQLADLWDVDVTSAKARAGQLLVDGQTPPVAPGTVPDAAEPVDGLDLLWAAGYTFDDVEQLAALWGTDTAETKARAAQAMVDREELPVPPSGAATPAG